jgi:hypothetical protein
MTLLATTLVVAAAITSSASAATLYTNSAHTTPVPVGTTIFASNPPSTYYWIYHASSGSVLDVCATNRMYLQVTQNSGGVFKASTAIARDLINCANSWSANVSGGLQISGSSTTVGANKSWASTTLTGSVWLTGITLNENFTGAGVSAQQPTAGASPVSVVLDHAATFAGGTLNLKVSGTYQLSGAYSLG